MAITLGQASNLSRVNKRKVNVICTIWILKDFIEMATI